MDRPLNDLIRIAAAGGGMRIQAGAFSLEDLIRIATAASKNGARIVVVGGAHLPTEALVRIGSAGRGSVLFED
jgi:DNA replication protein